MTLCVDGAMTHGELFAHGAAAMGEGRIEEARRLFTQALEADPTAPSWLCQLGACRGGVTKWKLLNSRRPHEFDGGISVRVLADREGLPNDRLL